MSGNEEEECGQLTQFERNKYFYGKLMTVRDFETEQRYFNEKRHLLNRLIHGIGLVCGLEVEDNNGNNTPRQVAGKWEIYLHSGVALDCCGREIVVSSSDYHEVFQGEFKEGKNYLYLKYDICEKEPCPALANASTCEEVCCNNRVEEIFKLVLDEPPKVTEEVESAPKSAQEYYEEHLKLCPGCDDAKVLLAVIDKSGETLTINKEETDKYRAIVYNNPMLYDLIRNHLIDFNNPHNVTAKQTGALKSIDGVSNPGGDVDLVEGDNITITPDTKNKSIKIGSTAGVEPATSVSSVQALKNAGGSKKYAREDHVHDLADDIVEFEKLATVLQDQLNTVFEYLRERALKCTVINFTEVGKKFENKAALELSSFAKEVVDNRKAYEVEDEFMNTIRSIFDMEKEIAKEIRKLATEESFEWFSASLKYLGEALKLKDPLKIATAQDEMCFYALLLESKERIDKVDFSPVIDSNVSVKFTPEVVSGMDTETKSELTKTKTAVILNEVYRNPDIKTKELAERVGMTVKSVESTVSTLVRGNILSGTDTKGYRLTI